MSEGPYPNTDNGYMPSSDLSAVQGMQLQYEVAAAWMSAVAASGGVLSITFDEGAYRDYAMQASMHAANPSLAPAGESTHGYGTCIDIYTGTGNDWAIANFSADIWVRDRWVPGNPETSAYEYNHWHYIGPLSTSIGPTLTGAEMAITIFRSAVAGVGQHYFYATAAGVVMSPEYSVATATVKAQIEGTVNLYAWIDGRIDSRFDALYACPDFTDAPGFTVTNQILNQICGMPLTFPLSPTNPFVAASYFAA